MLRQFVVAAMLLVAPPALAAQFGDIRSAWPSPPGQEPQRWSGTTIDDGNASFTSWRSSDGQRAHCTTIRGSGGVAQTTCR